MTHLLAAALVLQLSNFSGAPAAIVRQAQEEVTRVYAEIGVPLEWSDAADAAERSDASASSCCRTRPAICAAREKEVMGAAVRTAGGNADRLRATTGACRPKPIATRCRRSWCWRARSRTSSGICCCRRARTRPTG